MLTLNEFEKILEKIGTGETTTEAVNVNALPPVYVKAESLISKVEILVVRAEAILNKLEVNGKPYEFTGGGCPVIVTDESGQATVTTLAENK